MSETRSNRPIPLALTMLIALFSALVALALSGEHHMDMTANAATVQHQHATVDRGFSLRQDMRRLWEEHVMWTRLAVITESGLAALAVEILALPASRKDV